MRIALVLLCLCSPAAAQELPTANPAAQAQFKKTYDTMIRLGVFSFNNAEVLSEAQKVKQLVDTDEEIVRQLVVFVATTESAEDTHVLLSVMIWQYLHVSTNATIEVLAPYLDASDDSVRRFAKEWFQGHNDDEEYRRYIRGRSRVIPESFIKYLYEHLPPGRALLLMQSGSVNVNAHIAAARKQIEARQQGLELPNQEEDEAERSDRREILLAEHIVSNALWLQKHGFNERLQAVLPEAIAELEKLANRKEWWARMYVVYVMRQNPVLLQDHILRKLAEDENPLVSVAAKGQPAHNPSDGTRTEPLAAPRDVQSRAVGPTSIEVTWQASVGATSYSVQRRQPDT
jgi:hypothetical protein